MFLQWHHHQKAKTQSVRIIGDMNPNRNTVKLGI